MDNIKKISINAIHPKVLNALHATIAEAKARKMLVGLFCGLRTAEESDHLYQLGRTIPNADGIITNAKAWQSWHNYGLAGDIVFKDEKGRWTWNGMPKCWKDKNGLWTWNKTISNKWNDLGEIGKIFGLEWGGTFVHMKPDFPHFQMIGKMKNTGEAKKMLFSIGIDKIWERI